MAVTYYDERIIIGGTSTEPNPCTLQTGKTYTAAQYEGNGGAVYVESDGIVTGENVTFKDNSVIDSKGQGGAIYNGSGAVLNLTRAAFTGNNTTELKGQGGAIYNGGTATITDTAFSSNTATMGGAIFNNGGTLEVSGGTISGNTAKYGGAIQNFGGGTVNITGAEFSGNSAAADGGAIAHNAGSVTVTGATFSGNTARSSGGAISNTSTLTIADTIFSGNTAKYGGAISNTGTINMTGTVTLVTESDVFYNTGTLNWNLTGGTASYGSIAGYQYLNNDGGTLTITVDDKQEAGLYIIAAGDFSNLDGKRTFTLTGIEGQSDITTDGESIIYNDKKFTLATNDNGTSEDTTDDKLVLMVESTDEGGEDTGGGDESSGEGSGGNTPPEKPDGGGGNTPPEKPDGGGGEGGGGGGTDDTVTLTGVLQLDSGTEIYDGEDTGATFSSTTSDQNVVLAQNGSALTISNYTLNKTGDCSSEDNSNFYAVNAVVAAKSAAYVYIDNSVLNSDAEGANGLFASGEGSTIYAYNCTITSTKNSSRGLDATYEGTVIASKLTIDTTGDHCAALATDRGDGYISVTDSTLTTAGQGSPLIYSTGIIEADNAVGTSTGSQIAGIEGLSTIRIKNSDLTGSGKKASEPVVNGIIIYQSMSGDSTEGTATFEVADSTLASAINGGAMFYITNTSAVITVQNTVLDFDSDNNYLLKAAGNDGSNGWGTAGANGAEVVFTAIDQTLRGTVSVDGISSLDLYLIDTTYTGTFEMDTTYTGNGGTDLYISAASTWTVTESCVLQSLTAATGASITDTNGETVSIVNTSGGTIVSGTSAVTVTVGTYTSGNVEALYTVKDFEIDRTAFEKMYADSPEDPAATHDSDLDGNGQADIIMTIDDSSHPVDGATGAWLIQENQIPTWGDLSQRNPGWSIFGTGWTSAGKTTADVYIKSTDNIVGAWLTNDSGEVTGWETIGSFGSNVQVLGLGDFNGDNKSDLLLRSTDGDGIVGCYLTDGTGWNEFKGLGNEWKICGIGDLNGDGLDDTVLKHDAGFAGSWLTQTDGTVAWANLDTLAAGFEIVGCGDFNGDGVDDVLLKNGDYYGAWIVKDGSVASWMGLGTVTGTVEQIADFNADGVDDLRIRTSNGDLGALLVNGEDDLDWKYYGSVGSEWNTALAAL